jgi:hypothetical protein
LIVTTWVWGTKYGQDYIDRLAAGVRRHLDADLVVCRPHSEDLHLTHVPGCFARLRAFDPEWQRDVLGANHGEPIVCLDLDLVITGNLAGVFARPEPFVILQGVNSANPNPYNGSVWMVRAGYRPDVWTEFSLEAAAQMEFYAFPDDQAWFHERIPGAAAFGPEQGVYAFGKPGWPRGDTLPENARLVAFPGRRDPSHFTKLDWVRRHWLI